MIVYVAVWLNASRLDGEIESAKSPLCAACTTSVAGADRVGRPALPVPVTVNAWLDAAAPEVDTDSVQLGLASVNALAQPLNPTSDSKLAAVTETLSPRPTDAFGVIVTV